MKVKISIWVICISTLMSFVSCIQNDYTKLSTKLVWHPNLAVPLGKSYFEVSDLEPAFPSIPPPSNTTFTVSDTIDFDFAELFIFTEKINYLIFREYIENGFPAKMKVQIYFMNFTSIVDSLYKNGPLEIAMPSLDENGNLIAPFVVTKDVYLEGEEVDNLENVKKIMTKVELYDFDQNYSPGGLDDFFLKVETGLQADIEKEKN